MAKKIIYSQIRNQFRHDTIKEWKTKNPILLEGEIGVVIGLNEIGDNLEAKTQKAKIGDGIHPWNELEWWTVIQNNNSGDNITIDQTYNPESENAQSGKAVYEAVTNKEQYIFSVIRENYATKEEVGNIEIVLDNIIAIQNTLIGGDGV